MENTFTNISSQLFIIVTNITLALFFLYTVLKNRSKIEEMKELYKVHIFTYSVLFLLYTVLGILRILNGDYVPNIELFFWRIFNLIIILQGVTFIIKVLKGK